MDDVARRVREARQKAGLSQSEAARRLNVQQATVSRWESNSRSLVNPHLIALASAYETTPAAFFQDEPTLQEQASVHESRIRALERTINARHFGGGK